MMVATTTTTNCTFLGGQTKTEVHGLRKRFVSQTCLTTKSHLSLFLHIDYLMIAHANVRSNHTVFNCISLVAVIIIICLFLTLCTAVAILNAMRCTSFDQLSRHAAHKNPIAPCWTTSRHVVLRQRRLLLVRIRRRERNGILKQHIGQRFHFAIELPKLRCMIFPKSISSTLSLKPTNTLTHSSRNIV